MTTRIRNLFARRRPHIPVMDEQRIQLQADLLKLADAEIADLRASLKEMHAVADRYYKGMRDQTETFRVTSEGMAEAFALATQEKDAEIANWKAMVEKSEAEARRLDHLLAMRKNVCAGALAELQRQADAALSYRAEIAGMHKAIDGLHSEIAREQRAHLKTRDELIEAEEELDRCVTANMEMRATLDQMNEQLTGRGYTIRDLLADKAWARRVNDAAELAIQMLGRQTQFWKDPIIARVIVDLERAVKNECPDEPKPDAPNGRACTCTGTCKGADGLGDGWACVLALKDIE